MKKTLSITALAVISVLGATTASAGAVITNPAGTVALGVNDEGHLNTPASSPFPSSTGLAFLADYGSGTNTWRDATSPGCLCEGWGVSASGTNSAEASIDNGGVRNLTLDSFTSGANTATSVVHLTDLPGLSVTQAYSPADNAPGALFKDVVTIKNTTGQDLTDVKYVRTMDWDIPPTEFDEYVTIRGTATTTLLELSHDNGFSDPDPLASTSPINASTLNVDFIDNGPTDHGAHFMFNFGDLAGTDNPDTLDVDETMLSFTIFYGAAGTEADALAAIAAESIELFSLGQSNGGQTTGSPATFIFGFKGVGGTPVIPPTTGVPEPSTLALLGLGIAGLGLVRRRRKA